MKTCKLFSSGLLAVALISAAAVHAESQTIVPLTRNLEAHTTQTLHKTVNIDGLEIFLSRGRPGKCSNDTVIARVSDLIPHVS